MGFNSGFKGLNYSLHVSNKQFHHKEVIFVQAAYSISPASMGV